MNKPYTSVSCFTFHSPDSEKQMGASIDNRSGTPELTFWMRDKVQSYPISDEIIVLRNGICGNTVGQLKSLYELAVRAWEQCAGREMTLADFDSFEVLSSPEPLKPKEQS